MPIYKASFDFEHNANGWTETFYLEYTDIRAALDSAKEFRPMRVAMLGTMLGGLGPRLMTIRVSDVDIQRDALQYKVPFANQVGSTSETADNANLAVAVRMEAGALYRRTWYISGQPDACCVNGQYVGIASFETGFNLAVNFLKLRQWGVYAQNRASVPLLIASVSAPVLSEFTITTVNAHGLAAGNVVQVTKAPGMNAIRGKYFVKSVVGATGIVVAGNPTGLYTGGGFVRKVDMALQRFTNIEIDGITRKSRGRPSGGPVGRRRRRVAA